ncbi:MAG: glycosyltransferase [Pyrinomonadaceae bacterium]
MNPPEEASLEPRVSIITPLYNSSAFIAGALDSVISQTCPDWEIVLVDDGSPDDTRQKVEPYLGDDRVRYIRQENQGIAGARNTGILAARGAWVCLLDHDDRWAPDKLERQLEFIVTNGLDISATDAFVVRGEVRSRYSEIFPPALVRDLGRSLEDAGVDVFGLLIRGNFLCASSVMVRRSLFDRLGLLDAEAAPADDYEMWLRCAADRSRIGYLAHPLIEYHLHEHNFSRDQLMMAEKEICALKKTLARPAVNHQHLELLARRVSELSHKTARAYLDEYHRAARTGRLSEARSHFRKALSLAPSEVLTPRRLAAALRRGVRSVRGKS